MESRTGFLGVDTLEITLNDLHVGVSDICPHVLLQRVPCVLTVIPRSFKGPSNLAPNPKILNLISEAPRMNSWGNVDNAGDASGRRYPKHLLLGLS